MDSLGEERVYRVHHHANVQNSHLLKVLMKRAMIPSKKTNIAVNKTQDLQLSKSMQIQIICYARDLKLDSKILMLIQELSGHQRLHREANHSINRLTREENKMLMRTIPIVFKNLQCKDITLDSLQRTKLRRSNLKSSKLHSLRI